MTNPIATFWSGETLEKRLATLIAPFDPNQVDCAAYRLSVGSEIYVSPGDQAVDPETVTVRQLAEDGAFTVPPGQFAFLLTDEIVRVPDDALAFISIRAKVKFCGLINVSGFHVDPGYHGQLTFAVFNAGPVPVHLKQGDEIFLIWYASLDQKTKHRKDDPIRKGINTNLITGVAGELQSFASLSAKIKDVNTALSDRIHAVEKEHESLRVVGAVLIAVLVGVLVSVIVPRLEGLAVPDARPSSPATMTIPQTEAISDSSGL